jgi:serine/threonine protein kinase
MSQLSHPNTVKVFLYGELEDGPLYIVMEFLEGKNLNQSVRSEGPFAVERALPVLIQASGALDEAHRAGIIHRDLKPENIFLVQTSTLRDFPKVLDFGLAKVGERQMRPGSVILTQEGMVFGTPEFMSPEQAQGKVLTPASDIYSLATILYEMLTGKLPFDARSAMDFIQLQVVGQPIPLDQRVPGRMFPVALQNIIDRALAKRPEERFSSAADFAAAMQEVLDGRAWTAPAIVRPDAGQLAPQAAGAPSAGASSPSGNLAAARQVSAASSAPAPLGGASRFGKTNVALLVGVAVAFLALGVGLALLFVKLVR